MSKEKLLARGTQLGFIGRMITDLERTINHLTVKDLSSAVIALVAFVVTFIGVVTVEMAIRKFDL